MANFYLFPIPQWFNNSGVILSGGKIQTYAAGSTTPLASYTDSTGGTTNANPVILDSAGRGQIWLSAASYKFVIQTSAGVTLLTIDNYNPATINSTVAGLTDTSTFTMQQSTAATSGANQSSNVLHIQGTYWTGAASAVDDWQIQDVLGAGSNPTSTLTITQSGSSGTKTLSIPSVPVSLGSTLTVAGASAFATISTTQITNTGDTLLSSGKVVSWNADTGISRLAAASIAIGNGTQGDTTGSVTATTYIGASFRSSTASVSATGAVRLASSDFIGFRNNAGGADITIAKTGAISGSMPADSLNIGSFGGLLMAGPIHGASLQGATSGNAVTLLNAQGALGALTGDNTDKTIYTYTIPAGTIGAGKGIRVTVFYVHTTGNGAITYKMTLGTTALDTQAVTDNANAVTEMWQGSIVNNAGVQNAQTFSRIFYTGATAAVTSGVTAGASAENTANALALTWSFNAANTEQVTAKQWLVELIQ